MSIKVGDKVVVNFNALDCAESKHSVRDCSKGAVYTVQIVGCDRTINDVMEDSVQFYDDVGDMVHIGAHEVTKA